jgi:sucrose-phosphate phosphatase subfamily
LAKKVLAVDIDGTITLNGFGKIHLQALEKLRNLKNDGHHVIFVTGRSSIEAYFLSIFGGLTLLGVGENGGCITHGEIMTHKMIGDKNECQNAFSYLKKSLDESIKEKPVFPRLTEVVLDRTFDIKNAQAILDEEGFNVGLFDSGYAYHINSRGVDKGSGLIKALEMLNADLEDTIALGDSETDVPMFRTVKTILR